MKSLLIAMTLLLSTQAFAGANCPKASKETWIPEETMKAKIVEMGYEIKKFKIDGNCYEIYGLKDGKKAEVYFNPVDASIVKSVIK